MRIVHKQPRCYKENCLNQTFFTPLDAASQHKRYACRGVTRGAIPRAPGHYGGAKSLRGVPNGWGASQNPNNVASTFFNTRHLLLKDPTFEHGDAKLASCPGRHLTSLRPCMVRNPNFFVRGPHTLLPGPTRGGFKRYVAPRPIGFWDPGGWKCTL